MKNKDDRTEQAADLRRRAEEIARERAGVSQEDLETLSPEETRRLLYELRVHQIELEMQNDELRKAHEELEVSRARYLDLYDLAPAGYFTASEKGLILEANLTAATLLGVPRGVLIKQPLTRYILPEDQDIYYRHRKLLFETGEPQQCELRMLRKDAEPFWMHLEATLAQEEDDPPVCRAVMSDITERRRAEEALLFTEFPLDRMPPLVVAWMRVSDGRFVYVNEATCRHFGYSREELLGMTVFDVDPEFTPARWAELNQQLRRGGPCSIETTHLARDGRLVPVEVTAGVLEHAGEEYHCGLAQDITERKRAEEKLRESERKFRRLFEDDLTGDFITNAEGVILECNPAFLKMFGYEDKSEVLGQNVKVLYPEPSERVFILDRLRSRGKLEDYETVTRRKDGGLIMVSENIVADFDEAGNLIEIKGYLYDITNRKQAEEALRTSEELYRAVVESTVDAIVVLDLDRTIVSCNQGFCTLFGYSVDEVKGKSTLIIHASEEAFREFGKKAYELVRRTGSYRGEWNFRKKDGAIFPAETVTSVISKEGSVAGYVGVIRDMTERKQAEEEREKLQLQLNQSQKMESVGRLAGGVAHDFNNKLGVIIGNVQLAMDEVEPSDPLYESLEEIHEAARRSAELVRQLLAFARRQTASPKVINLNDTVSGMITMLRRLIGEDIDLAWVPGQDLWQVKIDPAQIDQILANLAVNARDAIAGVGKVTVETHNAVFDEAYCSDHPGSVPGQYVLLALSDNGKGMSKEVLEHVFEPFFTTKEVGKGTGLGLSTVYGIVKQNDGFINVYSEIGQGTTVKIYLPRYVASQVQEQQELEAKTQMKGTETVLMVEDERAILKMGKAMLESLGYRVLTADTPQEAIRLVGEHSGDIHLLFTDVVMPQMTGRELAERLKSVRPDLRVLFMSGYTADVIAKHGVLEKGVIFLHKPFTKKDLAAKVREALDKG